MDPNGCTERQWEGRKNDRKTGDRSKKGWIKDGKS